MQAGLPRAAVVVPAVDEGRSQTARVGGGSQATLAPHRTLPSLSPPLEALPRGAAWLGPPFPSGLCRRVTFSKRTALNSPLPRGPTASCGFIFLLGFCLLLLSTPEDGGHLCPCYPGELRPLVNE